MVFFVFPVPDTKNEWVILLLGSFVTFGVTFGFYNNGWIDPYNLWNTSMIYLLITSGVITLLIMGLWKLCGFILKSLTEYLVRRKERKLISFYYVPTSSRTSRKWDNDDLNPAWFMN